MEEAKKQRAMSQVLAAINRSERGRVRPHELVKTVSQELALAAPEVKRALAALVAQRELVYTYRDPCSFVERQR